MVTLRLKKREDRRLLAGHLWVFSNEVNTDETPLKGLAPGHAVTIESAGGKFLGHAYANPHSLICARITSRRASQPFDAELLHQRLQQALSLREDRFAEPWYRWVHGEGDFLPGLIVDRYDDVLVVQITTAGMELFKQNIVDSLQQLSSANSIYLRNDTASRALEQLPDYREWAVGVAPEALVIRENDLQFTVPPELGQKTGWFYDHRDSRWAIRAWARDRRVLDLYGYLGGFGLNATAAGAAQVLSIDASESAVAVANLNAERNGLADRFAAQAGDAVESMRALFEADERFDLVVLDPPAFIKRRKDRDAGERHYGLNNRLAMRLLKPGGVIASASCSQALDQGRLQQLMRQNMPKGALGLQLLAPLQQAADHPINIAMPETHYLKGVIARLM